MIDRRRDLAAAGVAGSWRAYVKIKRYELRSVLGRSVKSALNSTRDLLLRPSAGRYHRFVSFAAVIPSLVEPIRADSLV